MENYFYFMNFREGAADIVSRDLEIKNVRMRIAKLKMMLNGEK